MVLSVDKPKLVDMVILNNDVTSVEAVRMVLGAIFGFNYEEINSIIYQADTVGESYVGTYTRAVSNFLLAEVSNMCSTLKFRLEEHVYEGL